MYFFKSTLRASVAQASGLLALTLGATLPSAHAQTGLLNDTGQTQCYSSSGSMVSCGHSSVDDASSLPRQDGRYGRDAAYAAGQLPKVGGGAAGFDFTRICWNGSPEGTTGGPNPCTGTLVPNTTSTASASPAMDWACTRDNVTGLVWSLQTQQASWTTATGVNFAKTGHNTPARCGFSSGWRVPALRELLGIVHYGQRNDNIAIDTTYFPGTQASNYWSSDVNARSPAYAWIVNFSNGGTGGDYKSYSNFVSLVRSGQ